MSSNQTLILTAIQTRIDALALGRTKLKYTYDLEKNNTRAERNAYGFGIGAGTEVPGTTKALTLDQEFFVVLTENYKNRSDDDAEKAALTTIYDDLEAINRDFSNSKLGAPGIVLLVQQTDIEEPEKIADSTIAVRANYIVKHRATVTGTATLPDPVAPPETWSVASAMQGTTSKYQTAMPNIFASGAIQKFSIEMIVNFDMTQSPSDTRYISSWNNATPAPTERIFFYWFNSTLRFHVNNGTTNGECQAVPTRVDGTYHIVAVYDGTEAVANDRGKVYVNNALGSPIYSGTFPTSVGASLAKELFHIGTRSDAIGNGQNFAGKYIQVSVFNDALTAANVNTLYNGGSFSDPTDIASCVNSWWYGDNTTDTFEVIQDNEGDKNISTHLHVTGDIADL